MQTPFIIHDAEIALFPAWDDGLPMTGPSPLRDSVAPYFHCHTSLRWSRSTSRRDASFGDHRKYGSSRPDEITISVSHPEGVVLDPVGHAHRLPSLRGRYCLIVIFWSQEEKQWQRWQFFHVRIATDSLDAGDGSDAAARPLEFIAEHVEFDSYTNEAPPPCIPQVLGRVDYLCGPLHVPCMTYDMLTNTWTMLPYSDTGITMEHDEEETHLPYLMWDEQQISTPPVPPEGETSTFSLVQPRVERMDPLPDPHDGIPPSPYLGVLWQRRLFFSLQRAAAVEDEPGQKNILLLHQGITLETNGSPEPIEHIEQDQLLTESVAVFRVLDRVYATIGHDTIAVPAIRYDEIPLSTNLFFKLGDTILDDQAWWNLASPVLSASGPAYP